MFRVLLLFYLIILIVSNQALSEARPPNFLLIVTDDQNRETVNTKWMPNTKKAIFDQGITFNQAFISNPQCCPSRATILTGLYSKNNGQLSNQVKHNLKKPTCAYYLRKKGYKTGLVGKYLNSDTGEYEGFKKQQFSYWFASKKNNEFHSHLESKSQKHKEHSSTWIADKSINFLKQVKQDPFFLMVNFHAPHYLSKVDQTYQSIFKEIEASELDSSKPNFLLGDNLKPKWMSSFLKSKPNKFMRHEKQSFYKLQVLDIKIAEILAALKASEQLENTYIFFISDNGVSFGQHGINGKSLPYEKVIKVPFAISGPGIQPEVSEKLTGNVDIAPTIYALAGIDQVDYDGINILKESRDYYFLDGAYITRRGEKQPRFHGIVSDRYRLFKTEDDLSELYDIKSDPYQLKNLYYQADQQLLISKLEEALNQLKK